MDLTVKIEAAHFAAQFFKLLTGVGVAVLIIKIRHIFASGRIF